MDCILTFDVGTTAVKTCLFDRELRQLCCVSEEYTLETGNGFVELGPEIYWEAVRSGTGKALALVPGTRVRAVTATTQGETLILAGRDGVPLRKAIVWLDARADREAEYLSDRFPNEVLRRITGLPELTGACPISKLLWIRNNEPDVFDRTDKFLLLGDWLLFRLTGRCCSEKTLLTSTGYFSLETDDYWHEILDAAGIPASQLPEVHGPGELCGTLSKKTAEELGLPECVPVFTGAMDQIASAIGAGSVCEGIVTETTGTALVVAATVSGRATAGRGVTVYRHAIPGSYLLLSFSNTAGIVLKWFKEQFCGDLSAECGASGKSVYAALDELAETVLPLCNGLSLFPHFEGTTLPKADASARGAFFGIGLGTTRAHFLRAVLEGVAYMLRENTEALGCSVTEIRSLGGASGSAVWSRIKADVTGKRILTYGCESTSRGTAILASCGMGWYRSPSEACGTLSPGNVYEPGPCSVLYEKGYERHRSMYERFRPLF